MAVAEVNQRAAGTVFGQLTVWGNALAALAHHFDQPTDDAALTFVFNRGEDLLARQGGGHEDLFVFVAADTDPINVEIVDCDGDRFRFGGWAFCRAAGYFFS